MPARPSRLRICCSAVGLLVALAPPAFAQDSDGEVYALTTVTTGPVGSLDTIYRIVPAGG